MLTFDQIRAQWEARRAEAQRLGAMVSMAAVCDDVLASLAELRRGLAEETLTREQAAEAMGVHPDSVTRLVRKGKLVNVGTSSRPRFKRADLPACSVRTRRPRPASPKGKFSIVEGTAQKGSEIARDVIAGRLGRRSDPPKSA